MKRRGILALVGSYLICGIAGPVRAVDIQDTRMLTLPAVSREHVAFVYAEDLWVCRVDGSHPRRLTSHKGREFNPRFSPDGRKLAFSAEYDGNVDVFVVAAEGGVPRRLTYHPGSDVVQGFSVDGSRVLFTSPRAVFTNRYVQLFEVPLGGGHPERLPIPHAAKGTYSPNGQKIAYVPLFEAFNQWKNYRGGTIARIWLYDRSDHSVVEIPQPAGRANDTDPIWTRERVYFRSDRNGEFNIFSYDPGTREVVQVTHHRDFPVLSASGSSDHIVYEQAGYLHLLELATGRSKRLTIGVAADLPETRARYASGNEYIRSAAISPSGKRAVVDFRGEIVTVPAKKGDPRNLTKSPGTHEREPVWSPDGKWIAYFSDGSGEYELHVVRQAGEGGTRKFELNGSGFYDSLTWAPDSQKISFSDNSWALYWLDLDTGDVTKISEEPIYGPFKTLRHSWSPDSRWIAFTRLTETYFQRVYVHSLPQGESYAVTDGLSDVGHPVFDRGGKYLYVAASTDAGPVRQWFAMSNADMQMTNRLYVTVLRKGVPSPLLAESDEEEVSGSEEPAVETRAKDEKKTKKAKIGFGVSKLAAESGKQAAETEATAENEQTDPEEMVEEVEIDFEGIDQRIIALPTDNGYHESLQMGARGQLYYLRAPQGANLFGGSAKQSLYRFDLESRKEDLIASSVGGFDLSQDGKKTLLVGSEGGLAIVDAAPGAEFSAGKIATEKIEVHVDPRAEWEHMYHEAWRINRDHFYDPNMHGADWTALRGKYAAFLPHLAVRSDLNRVIQWLCSELSVGHHGVWGGDRLESVKTIPGGLLGADFEIDRGCYRFKKVYGGLNWNPDLRSPLTEPGVDVVEGEYLLQVAGVDVRPPDNLYRFFENSADKRIEITVGPDPDGTESRQVHTVPIQNEYALRNRDWVEGNLKKVHDATDGRVAYVYVPNTTSLGHAYFKRYFFPQADKEAIIVDERHNGGGQVADYYIDILSRPVLCHWATRYGKDFKTPLSSIQGPKVMLINETAGSGGDLLPWMFRKLGLGKLVGRPTWGGLVGVLGFPTLLDGGAVTAPNLAIWTEDGFIVENVGVAPDIEVEQYPAEVIAGRDPQLEKAIELILAELEAQPRRGPERPPYPVRVRR